MQRNDYENVSKGFIEGFRVSGFGFQVGDHRFPLNLRPETRNFLQCNVQPLQMQPIGAKNGSKRCKAEATGGGWLCRRSVI
jgi:hypothetical protein